MANNFPAKNLKNYEIKKLWFNARYHPQNNPTERTNKIIGNALRAYARENHRHWDAQLDNIAVALNTATNDVTGYTPFYLNFGREYSFNATDHSNFINDSNDSSVIIPNRIKLIENFKNIFKDVTERMKKSHENNKRHYDKNKDNISFNIGDTVYVRNFTQSKASDYYSAKLANVNIKGTITEKISDLIYKIQNENGVDLGTCHIKDIVSP